MTLCVIPSNSLNLSVRTTMASFGYIVVSHHTTVQCDSICCTATCAAQLHQIKTKTGNEEVEEKITNCVYLHVQSTFQHFALRPNLALSMTVAACSTTVGSHATIINIILMIIAALFLFNTTTTTLMFDTLC